jgi:hypothetical protein
MAQEQSALEQQPPSRTETSLKEFFERIPPGHSVFARVPLARWSVQAGGNRFYTMQLPALDLYCDGEPCKGVRIFESKDSMSIVAGGMSNFIVTFKCRNCQRTHKTYALRLHVDTGNEPGGTFTKFGELPQFGPPTPARVISILGPEKEYYLKGRRAENQGMGIAAFAYYRRVVENQKNRLFDEIIRVAEKIGASSEMLQDLNAAKKETQFTKAVEAVKHGIPSGLLIDGHNPLMLLHKALSEGLHAKTDEECLALATSIRSVLADLADRLGHALKGRAELDAAVRRLMK